MAARRDSGESAGCIAVVIGLLIAFVVIAWSLSTIGHALGLTPTYDEVFDRPDGWVTQHYRGVVWGYVLTLVAIAAAAGLLWLALRTRSSDPVTAVKARMRFRDALGPAALLAVGIALLPIGQRPGVAASSDVIEAAQGGNVPDLIGMTAARAERILDAQSLRAEFRETPYDGSRCRIVTQDPPPDSQLAEYEAVELACVSRVPSVVGMRAEKAETRLTNAGFDVRYANEPSDYDYTRCRVLRQSQSGSSPPDSTIGMRLRCAKPQPEPVVSPSQPVASCDPSYEGACLRPDAADYDCGGGSGDGPEFTGPVTVVGDDHYGLDSDGDGAACE